MEKALKKALREKKAALRTAESRIEDYEDEVVELKNKLETAETQLEAKTREAENARKSTAVLLNELKKRKAARHDKPAASLHFPAAEGRQRLQTLKTRAHTIGASFNLLVAEKSYERGGEFGLTVQAAERALRYARKLGRAELVALAWAWRGVGCQRAGEVKEAREAFGEAVRVAGGLGQGGEELVRRVGVWMGEGEVE